MSRMPNQSNDYDGNAMYVIGYTQIQQPSIDKKNLTYDYIADTNRAQYNATANTIPIQVNYLYKGIYQPNTLSSMQ